MKNLNKKIGVVVLSGLVLAGSGLASSSSVFAYQGSYYKYKVNGREYALDPFRNSGFESKWGKLAERKVVDEDLEDMIGFGLNGGSFDYKIEAISSENKRDIKVMNNHEKGKDVKKYFDNVDDFISHMFRVGMPYGSFNINVRGVQYKIFFNGM